MAFAEFAKISNIFQNKKEKTVMVLALLLQWSKINAHICTLNKTVKHCHIELRDQKSISDTHS